VVLCRLLWLILSLAPARAADTNALLTAWFHAQTNLHTWSADLTQTRTLKALAQPLVATGRVWFAAPNRFRWELGRPAQTIAVRGPQELLILYPRFQRAERYPLQGAAAGPWSEGLSLFEAGFPRRREDLERRFHIGSVRVTDRECELTVEPRAPAARRLMPQFRIVFGTAALDLRATELVLGDGSILRNDFTNAVLNPALDPALFEPEIGPGFRVSAPAREGAR
jgi:outer membrane lipoprotein-sorting protein